MVVGEGQESSNDDGRVTVGGQLVHTVDDRSRESRAGS
jgi:hypothetical protein